jgi:hypothetical protein
MNLRADHVAGGVFIAFGLLVFILGWDLPFGRITAPGAGMLPKLLAGLLIALALAIMIAGPHGETLAEIPFDDATHAVLVVGIAALATWLYSRLGFLLTMPLLVFGLLAVVERRSLIAAAIFAIALTLFAYWLFAIVLHAPLERGTLWF